MKVADYDVTVGADPEVFIVDTVKNTFISAHDIIPGTKKKPMDLDKSFRYVGVKGLACQADGTALEINIPPAYSSYNFLYYLGTALALTANRYLKPGQRLCATPVARYDQQYFKTLPASALELGCDPDYDAWNGGKANPRPTSLPNPYARTGAGHIAVGWRSKEALADDVFEANHFNDCIMMVQMMDLIHDEIAPLHEDKDDEYRRGLYGKRGAFRPKPFGVEYRTPSNSWLRSTVAAENMYNAAIMAFGFLHEGLDPADPAAQKKVRSAVKETLVQGHSRASGVIIRLCKPAPNKYSVIGRVAYNYNSGYRAYDFVPAPEVK